MFEAHIYSEPQQADQYQADPLLQPGKNYLCWHKQYQCNVRYWFSIGKRSGAAQVFLYIEYRNRNNSHGYQKLELTRTCLSKRYVDHLICQQQLSPELDPLKTECWVKQLTTSDKQ